MRNFPRFFCYDPFFSVINEVSRRDLWSRSIEEESSEHRVGSRRVNVDLEIVELWVEVVFALTKNLVFDVPNERIIYVTTLIQALELCLISGAGHCKDTGGAFPCLLHGTINSFLVVQNTQIASDSVNVKLSVQGIFSKVESSKFELLIMSCSEPQDHGMCVCLSQRVFVGPIIIFRVPFTDWSHLLLHTINRQRCLEIGYFQAWVIESSVFDDGKQVSI